MLIVEVGQVWTVLGRRSCAHLIYALAVVVELLLMVLVLKGCAEGHIGLTDGAVLLLLLFLSFSGQGVHNAGGRLVAWPMDVVLGRALFGR